jgi:threonylcarbamoyladenosine tRNA methylthiotransferase MtaB
MRVRLETIGCRLNFGEVDTLARELAAAGHRVVGPGEEADLCVFNSCMVTATAARKSRHALRRLRRTHPDAALVATGCFSELEPDLARQIGVDLVVMNRDKDALPGILTRVRLLRDEPARQKESPTAVAGAGVGGRTRAFLKVQDGCDNRCTFCIVTIARGVGHSRAPDEVVSDIRRLHADGFREIVLSGVHLGSYGHDLGGSRGLEGLVRRILSETDVPRIRLSSIEPWALDEAFLELFRDGRLLPHLHLPLQSGCESTVRRMGRRTDHDGFRRLLAVARSVAPAISISTDIMVGFPGETDDEFSESLAFVESVAFSRLHVFRFSPREGTRAATMPDRVPGSTTRERSRRMLELGARLEQDFNRRFVDTALPVLWEDSRRVGKDLLWTGLTGNYIRVTTETRDGIDLTNTVTDTTIFSTVPGGVVGMIDGMSVRDAIAGRELPLIQTL